MKSVYKIFFLVSVLLTIAAIAVTVIVWQKSDGSFLSVDFRGGSVLEVAFPSQAPAIADVQAVLKDISEINNATFTPSETSNIIIRSRKIDDATHTAILTALQK